MRQWIIHLLELQVISACSHQAVQLHWLNNSLVGNISLCIKKTYFLLFCKSNVKSLHVYRNIKSYYALSSYYYPLFFSPAL